MSGFRCRDRRTITISSLQYQTFDTMAFYGKVFGKGGVVQAGSGVHGQCEGHSRRAAAPGSM